MSHPVIGQIFAELSSRAEARRQRVVGDFAAALGPAIEVDVPEIAASPIRYSRLRQLQYACSSFRDRAGIARESLETLLDDAEESGLWRDVATCPLFGRDRCAVVADSRNESPAYVPPRLDAREQGEHLLDAYESACLLMGPWPGWRDLSGDIGQIILLDVVPTGADVMRSYTLSVLPCVLYLDSTRDAVCYAETLVHEAAHSRLNEFLGNPSSLPAEPTFWSPWKRTHRPVFGIIHAAYAFSSMMRLWIFLEGYDGTHESVRRRLGSRIRLELGRLDDARNSFDQAISVMRDDLLRTYLIEHLRETRCVADEHARRSS